MTEGETVGWHHQFNGHEFEQAPGDGEGQGKLTCCSPWGCKEWDMTEHLLLGREAITNLASILKSRDFANKGPSSQGYGFSSGHVWI